MAYTAKRKKNKNPINRLLLAAVLLLLAGLAALLFLVQRQADREVVADAGVAAHADLSSRFITHDGQQYPIKRNLSTVLLIGSDRFIDDPEINVEGTNRNRELADFIVVLVIDHKEKTITPLQLNRDTICEVSWLDEKGEAGGFKKEHLTFAHSYGSGGEDSCLNTVKTVRKLIYNAPINDYVAFTMDAVPIMNDMVGGVTLTLQEDMPRLGKDYVKGATIKLDGKSALRFVRYREHVGGSNIYRLKRQKVYLEAFTEATREAKQSDPDLAVNAFKKINPYLCTNVNVNSISDLVDQLSEYELCEALTPVGSAVPGEQFYEFYVNEDSLWDCVYTAYCKQDGIEDSETAAGVTGS